ncbi:MAG: LacI family DNA-binding transcriptional regulator [Gammaproteobacteria bacterium]|nr:LacI family DNA-binding transcriptional regulator [Gammaproteobacteria bacterium]
MNTDSPTLEDVAREAEVSTATISRAINEPDKVAKPTLKRIQHIIEELGYTPNFGGRVLASNRSNTVGAIIPTMTNAMFANGLQAFQEILSDAGVNLLVASSNYSAKQELEQIKSLIAHGADGLLLIGDARPKATNDFLHRRNIPYVIAWHYNKRSDALFAGFNNKRSAFDLTNHVLNNGHRKISMIAGISKGNDRAAARIKGVKQAVKAFGPSAKLLRLIETGYSLENGGDAFEQLIQDNEQPSVIICGNDVLAAGAAVRAKSLGLKIPQDFSITGFDDITIATAVTPPLTTVRVPHEAMGQAAAKLLIQQITQPGSLQSIEFETTIIERQSLASI